MLKKLNKARKKIGLSINRMKKQFMKNGGAKEMK